MVYALISGCPLWMRTHQHFTVRRGSMRCQFKRFATQTTFFFTVPQNARVPPTMRLRTLFQVSKEKSTLESLTLYFALSGMKPIFVQSGYSLLFRKMRQTMIRTTYFFLSSFRIRIEQAFGMLVARWRIIRGGLDFSVRRCTGIVCLLMKLHNVCLENDRPCSTFTQSLAEGNKLFWNGCQPVIRLLE